MATAKEVIYDALEEIRFKGAEDPIQKYEAESARRYLNDMMTMWAAKGINLGYTVISNIGETLTVPDGAIFGIKKLLAISISSKLKAEVSQLLYKQAEEGWKAILNLAFSISPLEYPETLPKGSGNYCGIYDEKYYLPLDAAILGETNGFISVEDDTEV